MATHYDIGTIGRWARLGLLVALLGAAGCAADAPAEAVTELTLDDLGNMTYDYVDGTATLVDGVYEEKPMPDAATFVVALELQEDLVTFGDLNGDGRGDAAVVLVNAPGGSGVFVYLAAVVDHDGSPLNMATTALGDRAQVEQMVIDEGLITLDVVTHGPDDPMCCPSLEATWTYALEGRELVLQPIDE